MRRLYNECQHATWYFLPWHRMYLYRFEQIMRAAVAATGGPEDWALPFWDYTRAAPGNALPWVFRQPTYDGGRPNPLFVSQRRTDRNGGAPLPASATRADAAMQQTVFTRTAPGTVPGFGGPKTGWAHFGSGFGALEQTPHNVVHVQIGGWMSDPNTAAQDPIFWLHHANIDRLWETWGRNGNQLPVDPDWLTESFELFDAAGARRRMTPADVVDIENQLSYTYEGLAPRAPAPRGGRTLAAGGGTTTPSDDVPAEMVGASETPIRLGATGDTAHLRLTPTRRPRRGLAAEPRRVYVAIDDVSASTPPSTSYEVVLDMGTPDDARDDFVVGVVGFFGVVQAASPETDTAPHGLRFTFDATEAVARLRELGLWDEDDVRISFEPIEEVEGDATEITVGRVSIFYE